MNWLARAVLHLVPVSWRDHVRADLEEEARVAGRRGWRADTWFLWQVIRIAPSLRRAASGDALRSDLRYALRSLARARWFTLGALLTFAIGIGANIAVFSAVDRILFRHLPYSHPQDLVLLQECSRSDGGCYASFPDILAARAGEGMTTLGDFAEVDVARTFSTSASGETPPLKLVSASPNVLRVLGVHPEVGRDVTRDEVRHERVVALLSHETWQSRYQGRLNILGQPVGPGAGSPVIVGVLPRGFVPPAAATPNPAWEGLVLSDKTMVLAPIARLKPGQSIAAAQAEVDALVTALAPQLTTARGGAGALPYIRVDRLDDHLFENFQDNAWLVVVAAALVLLLACTNLVGLMLARGRSRERDAAVRLALGASPGRLVSATVLETGVVCVAGTAVAWVAVAWASSAISAVLPPMFARYMAAPTDVRVATMAVLTSIACAMAAGLWPGFSLARASVVQIVQRPIASGRGTRLPGGRSLLVAEAALGMLLATGAALAVTSFVRLAREDLGYQPEGLYLVSAPRPAAAPSGPAPASGRGGGPAVPAQLASYEASLRAVADVPGIVGVAGGDSVMATGQAPMQSLSKDRSVRGGRFEVSAGFFHTVGTRVLAGREFSDAEVADRASVAILDVAALDELWPHVSPEAAVNRSVALPGEPARVVVGVVPSLIRNSYGEASTPAMYVPLGTNPRAYGTFIVRVAKTGAPPLGAIRDSLAVHLGVRRAVLSPVLDEFAPSLKDPRFRAVLLGGLAACAVLLGAAGIYALAAFEVSRRRHEVGVRVALGASGPQIRGLVIGETLRPVAAGVALGGLGVLWTGQWLRSFLFQIDAHDPRVLASVALIFLGTACLASWLPARRAARIDPAAILRAE